MNPEHDVVSPQSEDAETQTAVNRRQAVARFAAYTAPVMLAVLTSEKAFASASYPPTE